MRDISSHFRCPTPTQERLIDPRACGPRQQCPGLTREGSRQRSERDSRNAAISWPLRTSRRSPTSTGWFQSRREPRQFLELVGGRSDQRQLTLLRQHQQQVLVGQQDELAATVSSALPLALAVLEVDAREYGAVEAEGVACAIR